MNWRVSPEEDFPMVVHMLQNRGESNIQHGEIFEGLVVPVNFDLFSLGAKKVRNLSIRFEGLTW